MTDAIQLLHVDDDPEFTELTAEFIDREYDAFDIVQAIDAEEGLTKLERQPIDCVVSDYKLPGMDGIEFLEAVREEHPQLPFILFTGKGSETVASDAITAGATDYFRKERIEDQYDLLANRILNAVTATEARERVEERTREYRTLVEEAPVQMAVIDRDHQVRFVNSRMVETLGLDSLSAAKGHRAERFIPDYDDAGIERLDTVLQEREPVGVAEYEFTDFDGNTRHARGTIVPVTFEGDPAAQIVSTDITERKRQEKRVRQRHDQIHELHEVGVDIAACESEQEVYDLMVEAAERILDLDMCIFDSVEDGMLVVEATSSELTEYEESALEEGGLAGKAYREEESFLFNENSDIPEADPVGEYRSGVTVPVGKFGVFQAVAHERDTFDERDLELVEILAAHVREALVRLEQQERLREQRDQLQRENERLDQFASIVSHDIRNPLNVAQLRLDLAMDECNSEHLGAVARSVERMETLTDELLALARMGDTIDAVSVDLGTVVRGCWQNVRTADATLVAPSEVHVLADEARLQQLLENLLRNAIEHGGEDVTVTVGLLDAEGNDIDSEDSVPDDAVGFYVEDDGRGMTEGVRDQVFESGFSAREDGTGFGLAIVSRAAEGHGWDVSVTASDAGGARFEFTGVDIV